MSPILVEACDVPAISLLERRLLDKACFRDAYRASLRLPQAGIVEIFTAIFGHHPAWMKWALILRHRFMSLFGIAVPSTSEVLNFNRQSHYCLGDKIGVWPILALSESELIVGSNNKHLDFRLSVLKFEQGEKICVAVSTVCDVHNFFGKCYLFAVTPFHRWGVKHIIASALLAGRL